MTGSHLYSLGAADIGQLIRKHEISPVEVVEAAFERIRAHDGAVNAFMRLLEKSARDDARRAEKEIVSGDWRGPLHGVPIALKDIFDLAGVPTTAGSRVWQDFVPQEDASVVQQLKKAGAIIIGKVNLHELAFGITSRNPHFGDTCNPWDLGASCGGSSSGSAAALAAQFVPLTLGTDTGGSIRIPSAMCGAVGLKPTYDLVSRKGVLPLAWSMDHVGPMARRVEDVALAMAVLAPDPTPTLGAPPALKQPVDASRIFKSLVFGVPMSFFYEGVRDDIKAAVLKSVDNMKSMGAEVREVEIPEVKAADIAAFTVLFSEAASCLEQHVRNCPEKLEKQVLENVHLGMTIPATRYIQALRVRGRLVADLREIFQSVDVLVTPATMTDAHPLEAETVTAGDGLTFDVRTAMTRYTRVFNLAGFPVLCMPCGFSDRRLPVGMQIVGAPYQDGRLLEVGWAFQEAFPLVPGVPGL